MLFYCREKNDFYRKDEGVGSSFSMWSSTSKNLIIKCEMMRREKSDMSLRARTIWALMFYSQCCRLIEACDEARKKGKSSPIWHGMSGRETRTVSIITLLMM